MIREVVLITVSAVLFVQMGLSKAIQGFFNIHSKIASCPKCASFWSVLAYCLATKQGLLVSVAASFISAYAALWLSLLYDALALLYNNAYEYITKTDGTAEDAEADEDEYSEASATHEVPEM